MYNIVCRHHTASRGSKQNRFHGFRFITFWRMNTPYFRVFDILFWCDWVGSAKIKLPLCYLHLCVWSIVQKTIMYVLVLNTQRIQHLKCAKISFAYTTEYCISQNGRLSVVLVNLFGRTLRFRLNLCVYCNSKGKKWTELFIRLDNPQIAHAFHYSLPDV